MIQPRQASASQLDEPIALAQIILDLAAILAEAVYSTTAWLLDALGEGGGTNNADH
jgi:hypothetical protein